MNFLENCQNSMGSVERIDSLLRVHSLKSRECIRKWQSFYNLLVRSAVVAVVFCINVITPTKESSFLTKEEETRNNHFLAPLNYSPSIHSLRLKSLVSGVTGG